MTFPVTHFILHPRGLYQIIAERDEGQSTLNCDCGQKMAARGKRPLTCTTLLGRVVVQRRYYLCASCRQGKAPLDYQLGLCAGSFSRGLSELMALLGATQDAFEQATDVLQRLTLVEVSSSSLRRVTTELGALARAEEEAVVVAAWAGDDPEIENQIAADHPFYISMDGIMVNNREIGWKECKVGAVYHTKVDRNNKVRAIDHSYIADLTTAAPFGQPLWVEAQRRGLARASHVVVIGDGAEWIWKLAAEHFPQATQIVDWYHASQYVWSAARAIYGEEEQATQWADRALTALSEGRLKDLCKNLRTHDALPEVSTSLTYFLNNQSRMHYDRYRAQGLQIGSGSIESACKSVVAQRLKLAGMRWNHASARAVVTLRARLKSDRWHQTSRLLSPKRSRSLPAAA
ncbi:MAG: ISKra4 family transposase [Ardenticatenales bacterium]|nr:ISKra4 family transposase [Ardenticatenales bacterium]MCB9171768.1 ISKra4 family transposase [Ardenticatenales bacterium]